MMLGGVLGAVRHGDIKGIRFVASGRISSYLRDWDDVSPCGLPAIIITEPQYEI